MNKKSYLFKYSNYLILILSFIFILNSCSPYGRIEKTDDRFGVLVFLPWNDDWNKYMYPKDKAIKAMDIIDEAGIKWVRMDFSRTKVEPLSEGQYDFEQFDWLVKELNIRGISILGVLGYSPPWAASEGNLWNSPPEDIDSFARYIFETVKRYQGKVDFWEIWNEPDHIDYWQPQDNLITYAKLLKASYESAKSANPSCIVTHGGIVEAKEEDLKRLYKLGCKDYFDFVNIHLINMVMESKSLRSEIIGAVKDIKKVMNEYGDDDKSIWITEIGFPGVYGDKVIYTEQKQSAVLKDLMVTLVECPEIDRVFWAFFQDTREFFNEKNIDYFGLIRSDFSKKPAYRVFKQFIRNR